MVGDLKEEGERGLEKVAVQAGVLREERSQAVWATCSPRSEAVLESVDRIVFRRFCSCWLAIYNWPSFKKIPTLVCVMRRRQFYPP